MNLLTHALAQRTEVKLKKSKRDKDALTKTEIEILVRLLGDYEYFHEVKKINQKLNNQLKQLL